MVAAFLPYPKVQEAAFFFFPKGALTRRLAREFVVALPIELNETQWKTLLAEKKATPFYQFVAHNDLAKKIAELTEDLEELKSEKTMILSSFDCSEDTGIAEVKKSVAAM